MSFLRNSFIGQLIGKYSVVGLFIAALVPGLISLDDYGLGWDETAQLQIGQKNYTYVFEGDTGFHRFEARDYGVAIELPLYLIQKVCGLDDPRPVFLLRHILCHLFFVIGALYCYRLVFLQYNKKILALLAFLMVVLSPRLYGDSFVNSKDIPQMSLFFIVFYYFYLAFRSKNNLNFIRLGVVSGLLMNLRISGAILPAFAILFLFVGAFEEKSFKHSIKYCLALTISLLFTLYLTWPYLWNHPLDNFLAAASRMSKFNWYQSNLFMGEYIAATNVPWYYIPLWFGITVPLGFIIVGLAGTVATSALILGQGPSFFRGESQRHRALYLACFILPVLAVILLKSVLYDGWRHLYFINAPFVMLSIPVLEYVLNRIPLTFKVIAFSYAVYLLYSITKLHPYSSVYFNELANTQKEDYLKTQFDMDYWGISYRRSLEYILKSDGSDKIFVAADNGPGYLNNNLLNVTDRNRICFLYDTTEATYFITNYRWRTNEFQSIENKKVFTVKAGNNTINAVYKLR